MNNNEMTQVEEIPVVDVDGDVKEFIDYTIVPNQVNEFLRLRILNQESPAYNLLLEITSVETDVIEDSLSLRLGFEVIDEETGEQISSVYEELEPEKKAVFVRDLGNAFTNIILIGIDEALKTTSESCSDVLDKEAEMIGETQ